MAFVKRDPSDLRPAKKNGLKASKEDVETPDLSLPKERTAAVSQLSRAMILIFGEKKIGKTELAAQFDASFFFATEVGYKGLEVFKRDINSWKDAKGYLRLMKKDKTFSTCVIDTADLLYDLCLKHVCQSMGITHPQDEAYGKGWHAVKKEFEQFILQLAQTGKGVILISHGQEKEVKTRDGDSYDRLMPSMSNQARGVIEGMVDIWACYQYRKGRRVLTIEPDDYVPAGHRFGRRFRTPDGKKLRHIDMGHSAEEGFRHLKLAWQNKYVPTKSSDLMDTPSTKVKLRA